MPRSKRWRKRVANSTRTSRAAKPGRKKPNWAYPPHNTAMQVAFREAEQNELKREIAALDAHLHERPA